MGYDQARTAIEIGRKLDPDALEYHYSKYYLNDMLECYRENSRSMTSLCAIWISLPGSAATAAATSCCCTTT
ncbi:MAG: hypothetical protein ACLR1P_09970 [Oscillospiraceae bacterium]